MAAAVRFHNVSKQFRVGEGHDSLRDLLAHGLRGIIRRKPVETESTFLALNNVTFEISPGEAVGIIGPNGAGKSTALKLLAGILRPDRGKVEVYGRRAALIEVGAGFHGDLTGRENIFLNGTILGMSRAEVRQKLDSIVAFAGIERFLDTPVKRYSSGMYARLGFSIAAHVEPDVLLVDEVLSVGDAAFRLRCLDHMWRLVREGTALAFVTHDLEQMRTICDRTIVLERGRTAFEGSPAEAITHYLQAMSATYTVRPTDMPIDESVDQRRLELIDFRLVGDRNASTVWVDSNKPLTVEIILQVRQAIPRAAIEFNLRRAASGENLVTCNSGRSDAFLTLEPGRHTVTLELTALPLAGGQYFWNVRIWDGDLATTELDTPFRFPMVVDDGGRATGTLALEHAWWLDGVREIQAPIDGPLRRERIETLNETSEPESEHARESLLVR